MSSIRKIKKEVNCITGTLVDECLIYLAFHPETEEEKIDKIITDVLLKQTEIIKRLNNLRKAKDSKAEFKSIKKSIDEELIGALDALA